ncbi:MAG: hypothetical protein ACI4YA_02945 [Candidatus Spyradenecus sp.]
MARNLNIERRRKLIRHYQAMRRRRSPVRRAFTYWWASALLTVITCGVLALAVLGLWRRLQQGATQSERWALPAPGLTLHLASAQEVAKLQRQGNARRAAMALSDREVGISLAGKLPEPRPLGGKSLPELALSISVGAAGIDPEDLLPSCYTPPAAVESRTVQVAESLRLAGYAPHFPREAAPTGRGQAIFQVSLDAQGRAETVLRLAPAGAETELLRALRFGLSAQQGTCGPAEGLVICRWQLGEKESL